jgi:hypothetical protein
MLVVYRKIPESEIRETAAKAIGEIGEWFKANPKRRVCNVELWYNKKVTVKPKTIAEQINAAAEAAIKG